MLRIICGLSLILVGGGTFATPAKWVAMQSHLLSTTYIDQNSIRVVNQHPYTVEYRKRAIYTQAIPQRSIPSHGYMQGIDQMDCDNERYAIIERGIYQPNGKVIGEAGRVEHIYFESIEDNYELHKVYQMICNKPVF